MAADGTQAIGVGATTGRAAGKFLAQAVDAGDQFVLPMHAHFCKDSTQLGAHRPNAGLARGGDCLD